MNGPFNAKQRPFFGVLLCAGDGSRVVVATWVEKKKKAVANFFFAYADCIRSVSKGEKLCHNCPSHLQRVAAAVRELSGLTGSFVSGWC